MPFFLVVGLIHAVKTYERLAIEAAVDGDKGKALLAWHTIRSSLSRTTQCVC